MKEEINNVGAMLIKAQRFADDQAMMSNCHRGLQRVRPAERGRRQCPGNWRLLGDRAAPTMNLGKNIIITY